jgi:release factor glutamine methyltransferase
MNNERELQWLLQDKYKGQKTVAFDTDVKRIENGEPVDYVIGFSRFLGCDIDLSFRPFIPRPETEFWVEKAIEEIKKNSSQQIRCLDLCAGSGCIGVAVLKHVPGAHVGFAEINENFCKQIELNCKKNGIEENRFNIFQSNLFEKIDGQYDYILSNPPYVATGSPERVEQSVKDFEPAGALWSGGDGLEDIRRLLKDAHAHLTEGGILYMEFDSLQKDAIEEIMKSLPYRKCSFFKDHYGKWRYVIVRILNILDLKSSNVLGACPEGAPLGHARGFCIRRTGKYIRQLLFPWARRRP